MKENNYSEVIKRIRSTFDNESYKSKIATTDKNWIGKDLKMVFKDILDALETASVLNA